MFLTRELTRKYLLTVVSLCFAFNVFSQNIKLADSLFRSLEYNRALLYYEKAIFKKEGVESEVLLKQSYCYKALGEFEKAYYQLKKISDDSLKKKEILYEKTLLSYLLGEYKKALFYSEKLNLLDIREREYTFLYILILCELERWEDAENNFREYVVFHNEDISVDSLFSFRTEKYFKSKRKTKVLGMFFPPLAQWYVGVKKKAVVSLGLHFVSGLYMVASIYSGVYVSGVLSGGGLFWSFYRGGQKYALLMVERKNKSKKEKVIKGINKVILEIERRK